MTADEARQLSWHAHELEFPELRAIVRSIHSRICQAAQLGGRSIADPLAGQRDKLTENQVRLIFEYLRRQGYKVDVGYGEGDSGMTNHVTW